MKAPLGILTAAVLALFVPAPDANATIVGNGRWWITGSTYDGKQPSAPNSRPISRFRSDPVSVIWKGPDDATISIVSVMDHTNDHWTGRRINPRFPDGSSMKKRTSPGCTKAQRVFMRDGGGVNSGKWQSSRGYMSTNGLCLNQYHIRLWNSNEHTSFRKFASERIAQWVLAPIHHEKIVRFICFDLGNCVPTGVGHKVDIPFDNTRAIYYNMMTRAHCGKLRWKVNPESQGFRYLRGQPYSGYVARISQRHRSLGCAGA